MTKHLAARHYNPALYSGLTLNDKEDCCTFMLWNLSGMLVGYQTYSPMLPKVHVDDPKAARYYTHVTKPASSKTADLAVWGLETVNWNDKFLFLTEGVFDACRLHLHGLPAVAVLGANPRHLTEWLYGMQATTVACVQNDKAGLALAKYGQRSLVMPLNEDVGSMTEVQFNEAFSEYL